MSRRDYHRRGTPAKHPMNGSGVNASDRRSVLRALGVLGFLGVGAVAGWRREPQQPGGPRRGRVDVQLADNGMMAGANMGQYMAMFARHNEIRRTVTDIPGGVRATTESKSADLAALLQAHVADAYYRLDNGIPVMAAASSATLPILVRSAGSYRRRLVMTPSGITIEEISDDPALAKVIREHAREVSSFVADGMPAWMETMMGGMGSGGMGMGGMGMGGMGPMGHS